MRDQQESSSSPVPKTAFLVPKGRHFCSQARKCLDWRRKQIGALKGRHTQSPAMCRPFGTRFSRSRFPGTFVPGYRIAVPLGLRNDQANSLVESHESESLS